MSEPRVEDTHLDTSWLPVFLEWERGESKGLTLWNYLNMRADYDLAAAFSKLFWPDFVEVDGCILLAEKYAPENFAGWKRAFAEGKLRLRKRSPDGSDTLAHAVHEYAEEGRALEAMINHEHIGDLFLNCPPEVTYPIQLLNYLARILLVCWKHALEEAFPDNRFEFDYVLDDEGDGPMITFYQSDSAGLASE